MQGDISITIVNYSGEVALQLLAPSRGTCAVPITEAEAEEYRSDEWFMSSSMYAYLAIIF